VSEVDKESVVHSGLHIVLVGPEDLFPDAMAENRREYFPELLHGPSVAL
jgi:hypothetical protein